MTRENMLSVYSMKKTQNIREMLVPYLQVVQNVNIRHWPNLLMFTLAW